MAQSGHHGRADRCPLLGVKRTLDCAHKAAFFLRAAGVQNSRSIPIYVVPRTIRPGKAPQQAAAAGCAGMRKGEIMAVINSEDLTAAERKAIEQHSDGYHTCAEFWIGFVDAQHNRE